MLKAIHTGTEDIIDHSASFLPLPFMLFTVTHNIGLV